MKVVIVEDDITTAQLFGIQLEVLGVTVGYITRNFDKAHEYDWDGVDAVLVDMHLGEYLGSDILSWLERNHPSIARVLVSGDVLAGVDDTHAQQILIKPTNMSAIKNAIGL